MTQNGQSSHCGTCGYPLPARQASCAAPAACSRRADQVIARDMFHGIRYYANPVAGAVKAMNSRPDLGMIVTPKQGNKLPAQVAWCADNGCFGDGYPGDDGYLRFLGTMADQTWRCDFATAPDVVGDAAGTLARSVPMLQPIRDAGYPVALVAQDGLETMTMPWNGFDVLFLGGSTEWKLGPGAASLTRQARERGLRVHMGRVNSRKRLRYAAEIGCTSADGTYLTFGPSINLPKLLGWLDDVNDAALLVI
jgi:hypothetical protein